MSVKDQLKGRSCLTLFDYTTEELRYLLDLAKEIKQKQKNKEVYHPLKGKVLGMIFEKSSTRTRVSFETGIYQLGGTGLFLSSKDLQLGRGEPISDTAQVLSGYLDGIMIRTFKQADVEALAHYGSIPVINGLTDDYHPCQVLADLQTIEEVKGQLEGLTLTYIGDGNNMAHSLMIGAVKMGMHFKTAAPEGYLPNEDIVERAKVIAEENGVSITITTDPKEAMTGSDIVYTDVWASMGQESEQQKREALFKDYQVNEDLVSHAKDDYLFLHCLPAHRGEEVTADVIDGKHSVIFQEAENRLHAQKALMVALMAD